MIYIKGQVNRKRGIEMGYEQKGKNKTDLQQMNRSLVLRTIQGQQRISRVEISKMTGLNQATVTNIVGDLINWGIVEEVGLSTGKNGRRAIMLSLAVENYAIIGIWLTRRHFIVGLFDIYGECRQQESFAIGLNSPIHELLDQMVVQIRKKARLCKNQFILGVALALPGPYIKSEGQIALLTARQDWQNVNIAQKLSEKTGFRVMAEHDVKAAAVAEWFYTQNYDENASLLCIMPGQGVGAGVIDNGKLLTGSLGLAGEIGHMSIRYDGPRCECGNYGCLEGYCSTLAIQRRVKELAAEFPQTMCSQECNIIDLLEAYAKGDALARHVIDEAARYLGYGIANIANLYNPEKIIIGDELSKAGERFLEIVKNSAKERIQPKVYDNMSIVYSTLPNSVLSGACLLLIEEMVKIPDSFRRMAVADK